MNALYPLVSIIIPCYNDGKYLLEAVDSALSQTYPNIEIIIVNDASYDQETISTLSSIANPKIHIYHNEKNIHLSGTRNKGISLSKGKYILPLDSDDKIDKTYIQKAVEIMENDTSIGVVYCKANLFGLQNSPWYLPDYSIDNMLIDNIVFATALFYKEDWNKVGGYSEDFKSGLEDYNFWLSIIELGKEFYRIPEVLFFYRKKEQSMLNSFDNDISARKETYKKIYSNHPRFFEKHKETYIEKLRNAQQDILFENRKLINALALTNKSLERLKYEKSQIENSTFWRTTKPARYLTDIIKKLFNRLKRKNKHKNKVIM